MQFQKINQTTENFKENINPQMGKDYPPGIGQNSKEKLGIKENPWKKMWIGLQ